MANQVAKIEPTSFLKQMSTRVSQLLPSMIDKGRFMQICMQELRNNDKLLACSQESLVAAIIKCSREGLEPGEECYLLPRWSSKTKSYECSYQRGYLGILSLARRSGQFSNISVGIVHENDEYEVLEGTENCLKVKRSFGDRGDILFYWCSTKTTSGESSFTVMSRQDCEIHRDKYASSRDKGGKIFGPWIDSFDSMALKTVIIKHLKYQPKSYEYVKPEGVFDKDGSLMVENETSSPQLSITDKINAEVSVGSDEKVMKSDESVQENDEIPSMAQWSPAAQSIIDQVDKLGTSMAIDNYRASKRAVIDTLGDEADEVFNYIENAYQLLLKV